LVIDHTKRASMIRKNIARKNIAGDQLQIDSTAFVDPSAVIIGRGIIGGNTYIGPGVVLRADRFSTVDEIS
jgi:carbonic anhydrase/acetyltransferase-like protein (isoleucine patch superfamily)